MMQEGWLQSMREALEQAKRQVASLETTLNAGAHPASYTCFSATATAVTNGPGC